MRFVRPFFAVGLALGLSCATPAAQAQQEVQVAATAFAEGQQAQLRGDFVRAAELFEIADQAVPSPAALRSAIRNRDASGQSARAATLALRAVERYPEDRETRAFADSVLTKHGPKLGRVRLRCNEPCTATADGGLLGGEGTTNVEFFVPPGPHTFRAAWAGREPVVKTLEIAAGQALELPFEAPARSVAAAPPPVAATPDSDRAFTPAPTSPPTARASERAGGGLPPTVFWVGVGLTAVTSGVLVWSGLDTLSARDDYEDAPTRSGYEDGVSLERRTNVLLGASAVLGVATAIVGVFATDWGDEPRLELEAGRSSAVLSLRGKLP